MPVSKTHGVILLALEDPPLCPLELSPLVFWLSLACQTFHIDGISNILESSLYLHLNLPLYLPPAQGLLWS